MSEAKHTKGPWTFGGPVVRDHDSTRMYPPLREQFWEVGGPGDYSPPGVAAVNSEADARLIAAAPDLLAVCQQLLQEMTESGYWHAEYELRAAIAKATGED